jgi:hypothetical protein
VPGTSLSNSSALMVPRLVSIVAVFIGVGVGCWGLGLLKADG